MEIKQKYLPIGTVCMLKGATKRLMITGYCSISDDEAKMYDYCGCMYPEGVLSSDQTALFDHEQIEKVDYYGFVDEEQENFMKNLNALLEKELNVNDSENSDNNEDISSSTDSISENLEEQEEEVLPIGPGLPGFESLESQEEEVLPVGPGLPGFESLESQEEEVPPIGPGLPGFESLESQEEEVPPVGPGLPGFESLESQEEVISSLELNSEDSNINQYDLEKNIDVNNYDVIDELKFDE